MNTYPAPAKLNLMLRVTGRRADGYHLLQTVFRFVDFCDSVKIGVRDDGRIVRGRDIPGVPQETDLAVRAARLLQRECGVRLGAQIEVEKHLPMGGGLGGGSSDAATTLLALNALWRLNRPRDYLRRLAVKLGADVPVFIFGQSCVGRGIGEELAPLALPAAWYLILLPGVSVATAEVFQDPDLIRDSIPITIPPFSLALAQNDLEAVVCRRYPEVRSHLQWLKQFGRARMTGSGACVFVEFETESEARAALRQLPATMRGVVARGLDNHPLHDL